MSVECPNCGYKPPRGHKAEVCEYCGTAFSDIVDKAQQDETNTETEEETGADDAEESGVTLEEEEYADEPPVPLSSPAKNWIVVVLLAVLAAIPTYLIIKDNNEKEMFAAYYQEGINHLADRNYREAAADLSQALKYRWDVKAQVKLNETKTLLASEQSFEAGMAAMDNKDYRGAVKAFGEVIELDFKNFEMARQKLAESQKLLAAQQVANAKSLYAKVEYVGAYTALQEALSLDPQLKEAIKLKAGYAAASQKQAAWRQAVARDANPDNVKFVWVKNQRTKRGTYIIGYDLVNKSKWTSFKITDINPTWSSLDEGMPNFEEIPSNYVKQLPVTGGPVIKPGQSVKVRAELSYYIYEFADQFRVEGETGTATAVGK